MSTSTSSTTTITDPAYQKAAMSYAEWKREPTLMQVLFGLQLPYRPPRSLVGRFLWRRRVWVEVTFALSMLEPWEKFLVLVVMYFTLGLVLTGLTLYFPHHVEHLKTRTLYYLTGREPSGAGAAADLVSGLSDSLVRLKDAAAWGLDASLSYAGLGAVKHGEL